MKFLIQRRRWVNLTPILLCFLGFFLSINQLFACGVCKRVEIASIPLEIWGAILYLGTSVLYSLGRSYVLRFLLLAWVVVHSGLVLHYQTACTTCQVLLVTEIILFGIVTVYSDQQKDIRRAAGVSIIFICITVFFAFKTGLFQLNLSALAEKEKKNVSRVTETAIQPNNKKQAQIKVAEAKSDDIYVTMMNTLEVLDDQGERVSIRGPVLFFAWW